jgi:muramidase (phage lysozyme)
MTPIALKGINENVTKFLMLITHTEGTDLHGIPYNTLFAHRHFTDLSKHPNIKVPYGNTFSTAAGRYQILYKTSLNLKMKGFSPEEQDQAAIDLIKGRKAYADIISGDWEAAINKCNKEWASLPNSPYGQPTHTMQDALKFLSSF